MLAAMKQVLADVEGLKARVEVLEKAAEKPTKPAKRGK